MDDALPPVAERLGTSPPAVPTELRKQLLAIAQPLTGPRPVAFAAALAGDYLLLAVVIGAMVSLAWQPAFWLLLPLAWLVIAARQHAILVLMHDATHGLAARNRTINEIVGELLCGAPMLVTMSKYRIDHLQHHRTVNGPEDPDWRRKLDDDAEAAYWMFPRQESALRFIGWSWLGSVRYLLRSFTHLSKSAPATAAADSPQDASPLPRRIQRARQVLYLSLAIGLTWFGGWALFLLLWLAPILLVLPLIMRIRSIAEHFAVPNDTQLDATRTIRCGWLEAFLLAPHQVNYHLDHHLQAAVSFAELPTLHQRFLEVTDYREQAWLNDGYFVGRHTLRDDRLGRSRGHSRSAACNSQLPNYG